MELKEFIKDTIIEIAEGVEQANELLKVESKACVSPSGVYTVMGAPTVRERDKNLDHFVSTVNIRVNVEVVQSSNDNGKAGFDLKIFSGSAGTNESESNRACQEINLTLPVVFTF